ncbi:AzlD domain-containing protein [Halorussus amylolyticus]|uniref:AzlD domain-containing protein n=1 Tax=Halorussus amylolyticus TaxID=1126242 RepID=UPI0010432381|nr:AzlD domain-containing protein [Halorussus amylolyticus]
MSSAPFADSTIWFVIVAASVGTFGLRLSFIALFGRIDTVPPGVERALQFVPAAVLTALVVPDLVYLDGAFALGATNPRLLAGGLAAVVAWRTENMLATIGVGMVALWIIEWLPVGA